MKGALIDAGNGFQSAVSHFISGSSGDTGRGVPRDPTGRTLAPSNL